MDLNTAKHVNLLLNYGFNKVLFNITQLPEVLEKMAVVLHCESLLFSVDSTPIVFDDMMKPILDYGYSMHLFTPNTVSERDAFEAKLMDVMMPSPSDVKTEFHKRYLQSPDEATSYLYRLSKDVNYIKVNRLAHNIGWRYQSAYGNLELTINLAKPEKDPRDIARAKTLEQTQDKNIPLCVLCKENEQNYYNARMNLRIVPITLANELWHFQYSPYLYYHEHAIILHDTHRPMHISLNTVDYLIDFVDHFPSYFIGSNADLPIVGGSILNHDHFQAGKHTFAIENAKDSHVFETDDDEIIHVSILHWPLSTLRLKSMSSKMLKHYANHFIALWKSYSDQTCEINAFTGDTPHNTVTPILRKKGAFYEMDLILRNNRTTKEHPLGLFHPHEDVWHIKKENIGLIEAMGLAILPGRLKDECQSIISSHNNNQKILPKELKHHQVWYDTLKSTYSDLSQQDLNKEIGKKFERVLLDAGVFKQDKVGIKGFKSFVYETLHHMRHSKKHIS
ncbi:MAG: galactose-1-phosphate uridylyltransferase [Acholeplasmataceae bacterium]